MSVVYFRYELAQLLLNRSAVVEFALQGSTMSVMLKKSLDKEENGLTFLLNKVSMQEVIDA